jgi:REP element-mobilizing transposase RayT
MPDHVHMLVSPLGERKRSLTAFMQAWKSSVTLRLRSHGVRGRVWQREFFDRLLRSGESAQQKWEYVEQNPVRAGLVKRADEYPYSGAPEEILVRLQL